MPKKPLITRIYFHEIFYNLEIPFYHLYCTCKPNLVAVATRLISRADVIFNKMASYRYASTCEREIPAHRLAFRSKLIAACTSSENFKTFGGCHIVSISRVMALDWLKKEERRRRRRKGR